MMLNKIKIYWSSLQQRERNLLKIIFFIFPLALSFFYLMTVWSLINTKQSNLLISKNNFQYVYNQAINYQKYIEIQKSINQSPKIREFLITESDLYKLDNFRLITENNSSLFYYSDDSIENSSSFLTKISNHPGITLKSVSVRPALNIYELKVEYETRLPID